MKSSEEIKQHVRDYITGSYLGKEKIHDNSLIFQEGFFDSMGFVRLITFLEEEFNIEIRDNDLVEENFESIDSIVNFLSAKEIAAA
jgi:acyl carrier protein